MGWTLVLVVAALLLVLALKVTTAVNKNRRRSMLKRVTAFRALVQRGEARLRWGPLPASHAAKDSDKVLVIVNPVRRGLGGGGAGAHPRCGPCTH